MRRFLLSIPFGFLLLIYSTPSLAKSIWLECGVVKFNLDDDKREYSTTYGEKLIQGSAMFFPSQISFSVPLLTFDSGGGIRHDYSIDRKTLEYQVILSHRFFPGTPVDIGWEQDKTTTGTCKIIKNPAEGNKI